MSTAIMEAEMNNTPRPYCPISPGEILREELEARDWTQGDFAEIIGRPKQVVNEIISGKKAITPETSILFAEALGTSAEVWLNLEASYRLDILHQKQQKANLVSRKAKLYSKAPIKELIKREWIQASKSIDQLETAVLRFLGIPDLNSTPSLMANFRRTDAEDIDTPSLVAWARKAEVEANKLTCPAFKPERLKQAIPEIILLSAKEHTIRQVPHELCELGMRLVFVSHLPRTRVDGAAFWLDETSPVIALSLRLNRVDNFWFTLMHEIAHILSGHQNAAAYLDNDLADEPQNETERQTNQTARDWLIPPDLFSTFVESNKPFFSKNVVICFAQELGIHPAIIVGRLQHEKQIPYTNLRNILGKVRPIFAGIDTAEGMK